MFASSNDSSRYSGRRRLTVVAVECEDVRLRYHQWHQGSHVCLQPADVIEVSDRSLFGLFQQVVTSNALALTPVCYHIVNIERIVEDGNAIIGMIDVPFDA